MKSFAPTIGLTLTRAGPAIVTWLPISGEFCGELLPGPKINSRRCEDISRSTIFGLTRQGHLNNGAVSASVLREIRDLQEMIVRHSDYECRIVAGDDLALGRIGESNCCGSENKRSDKKSRGERLHDSQN